MTSIKWGMTAGIFAAIISILLGVIFGVSFGYILLRAVIFLFSFFALGAGLRVLIDNYLPELTYIDNGPEPKLDFDQTPQPGSQINITLGGMSEYAVPEMYRNSDDDPQELGNIEDLISGHFRIQASADFESEPIPAPAPAPAPQSSFGGIDLTTEDDYNIKRDSFSSMPQEFESFQVAESPPPEPSISSGPAAAAEKPAFTPIFGGDSDDLGALPDLGSMATVFSTGFEESDASALPHMGSEADSSQGQYNKGNKPQPLEGDFQPQELAQGIRTVLNKDQGR